MPKSIICAGCGKEQTTAALKNNDGRCTSALCETPCCGFCGCTEDAPCTLQTQLTLNPVADFCRWIAPGICSNPKCVEAAYASITLQEILQAQRYHQINPLD